MRSLFVDCQSALSGDMLLSAFLDLGLPKDLLEEKINQLSLSECIEFSFKESSSFGIRGMKLEVEKKGNSPFNRYWKDISLFIEKSSIKESIKKNILKIYQELASAESIVHGCAIDDVAFHEISSIETLLNITGVCLAFDYFQYEKVFSAHPPSGRGHIKTAHGLLPVPVPTVLEIAKRNNIGLYGSKYFPAGELTTPSGIALISSFADRFEPPVFFDISKIGVGLGTRNIGQANFLRVIEIDHLKSESSNQFLPNAYWQNLVSQEAWIDDASPEDLAELTQKLRAEGALEVVSYPVQMKKGRQGVSVKAIVANDLSAKLRTVWFLKGTTLGLRESFLGRWILLRRKGICKTIFGDVRVKQIKNIDGIISIKPEHDELIRLSNKQDKSLEEIRIALFNSLDSFIPEEDWSF
tara:strand:- start:1222 stop:2454 length:1233 start_codon:yes stop_codon:yes gene_type:complete